MPYAPEGRISDLPLAVAPRPEEIPAVMSVEGLEALALAHNPTLAQARAFVDAQRSAAFQASRYPNPVVGYVGDQIGIEGTAGEMQGAFVTQQIVTGGKLRLSRAKYLQRSRIAVTYYEAQRLRIVNDVHLHYYHTLVAQRLVAVHRQLLANANDRRQTRREMLNLGQANQADLLDAEIEARRADLALQMARQQWSRQWRELASVVAVPELELALLADTLEQAGPVFDWHGVVQALLAGSPELAAARQKVRHDQIAVARERVEPIPNVQLGGSGGYNFETENSVAGLTVGVELPLFNKNRGTIGQAQADLRQAQAEVRRLELELTTRAAAAFENYATAKMQVDAYQAELLPKSRQAFQLLRQAYDARRAVWPDVLTAQERMLKLEEMYAHSLGQLRQAEVLLRGMLLSGALMRPPQPMSGGHIDATPDPR